MSWPSHLQRYWYALAQSRQVGRRPRAWKLFGQPVALARLGDGRVLALDDRCPHRQAPLSAGCVQGDGLQCPYHGWRFGVDGRLQALPGLPSGQSLPSVRARAWAVREHEGIVWVHRHADAASEALPAMATAQPAGSRRFLWSTVFDASLIDALENVLDATHTHYVHAGLVRRAGSRRPMQATLQPHADGFTVDYHGAPQQSGLIYRLFEAPRTRERAHFHCPASVQFEYGYRDGSQVCIGLHFAPMTAQSTRLHVIVHIHGRWAPAWAVRLFVWPFLRRVAMQDRRMLRLQSDNRARFGQRDAIGPLDVVRPWLEAFHADGTRDDRVRHARLDL